MSKRAFALACSRTQSTQSNLVIRRRTLFCVLRTFQRRQPWHVSPHFWYFNCVFCAHVSCTRRWVFVTKARNLMACEKNKWVVEKLAKQTVSRCFLVEIVFDLYIWCLIHIIGLWSKTNVNVFLELSSALRIN